MDEQREIEHKSVEALEAENSALNKERFELTQRVASLEAENARLRAALNQHGLWVNFNQVAQVLDDINVRGWLTVHANALGFAIGYFRYLQNVLDGKEDQK